MTYLWNVLGIDIIFICLDGLHLNYENFCFDIFELVAKTMVVLVMEINVQLLYPVLNPSCWHSELISLSLRVIGFHALYARFSLPGMVKHQDRTLDVHTMIAQRLHFGLFPFYPFRFVSFTPTIQTQNCFESPLLQSSHICNGPCCSIGAEWFSGIAIS
jgi:hypothetical protein